MHWERQIRNEEKMTKVLKKEQKSRKMRIRTRKGQKVEHHQAPSIYLQKEKKKSAKNWGPELNRSGNNQWKN